MLNIVLYQPEIPPNTGNIIRLCANTGFRLHLIEPLGFEMDDKKLRRAGLDYREFETVHLHASYDAYRAAHPNGRVWPISTKGKRCHSDALFNLGDTLLFGPETRGLPAEILSQFSPQGILRLPMLPHSRSMNLSNAAAVIVYEAWRQQGFHGGV